MSMVYLTVAVAVNGSYNARKPRSHGNQIVGVVHRNDDPHIS